MDRRRKLRLKLRHQRLNPRHRVDDIGIRLAADLDLNHRIAVYHAEVPDIFVGIDDAAEVRQADRRALPIDHHQILVIFRQEKLVGRINRGFLVAVRERAFRLIRIGALQERADLIETHVVTGERLRIHFHANRRKRTSPHLNLAHASDLCQLLRKHRGGDVVQLRPRHYIRLEGHQQNRLVGRIDFPVTGEGRKIRRKKPRRRVNGRLHFASRSVDVAAQIELERDRRGSNRASGCHFRDARDARELLLEGSRDGRRHHVGTCSGQAGANIDGREVDLRQCRDRQ